MIFALGAKLVPMCDHQYTLQKKIYGIRNLEVRSASVPYQVIIADYELRSSLQKFAKIHVIAAAAPAVGSRTALVVFSFVRASDRWRDGAWRM